MTCTQLSSSSSSFFSPSEAKRLFVPGFYFFLPPSLSLPSEQSVSVATSHPSPLHPDWQMQCQTFWSRTHLPLLLHSPGQPSVNTSCMCQTAEQVRARKSGVEKGDWGKRQEWRGGGGGGGHLEWTGGRRGTKMIKDSIEWTYSTIHLWQDRGCGEGRRECGVTVVSHEFQVQVQLHWEMKCMGWKRRKNLLKCLLKVTSYLKMQWHVESFMADGVFLSVKIKVSMVVIKFKWSWLGCMNSLCVIFKLKAALESISQRLWVLFLYLNPLFKLFSVSESQVAWVLCKRMKFRGVSFLLPENNERRKSPLQMFETLMWSNSNIKGEKGGSIYVNRRRSVGRRGRIKSLYVYRKQSICCQIAFLLVEGEDREPKKWLNHTSLGRLIWQTQGIKTGGGRR